jgi:Uma2 family endonuclease
MRAVILHVREQELAERRAKGLDRWDEVWEGVLHMTPAPNREHQRVVVRIVAFLEPLIRESGRGTLEAGINVFREAGTAEDYRIPDLTFVARGRESILHQDGVRGGGPDAVIEVRSPEDETYEKLPFFAAIGVKELIVCQRDSKEVEIYRLAGSQYVALQADAEGWLASTLLSVRFRRAGESPARLRIEDLADRSLAVEI